MRAFIALLACDAAGQCGRAGLLEKAIEIDPDYGQALSLLATSHMSASTWAGQN
jgi:hypothetical protein